MKELKRVGITLVVLGLILVTGPFFWGVDVGEKVFSNEEAWKSGIAQPTIVSGALLIYFAIFLLRGALWPRWPIVLWCPFSIIGSIAWDEYCGAGSISLLEFIVEGIPVILFWLWAAGSVLFKQPANRLES
jgi:hypothetical protein